MSRTLRAARAARAVTRRQFLTGAGAVLALAGCGGTRALPPPPRPATPAPIVVVGAGVSGLVIACA